MTEPPLVGGAAAWVAAAFIEVAPGIIARS